MPHNACPDCGGVLGEAGSTSSEMLDWVPAHLRVVRVTRPKCACRACGTLLQAPAPERVLAAGLATPGLIAHVLVSRYADHLPLYRQSQVFDRHGLAISRSTLSGWIGAAGWWLEALHERVVAHVMAGTRVFADDTTLPVLDPGRGRTKTGRLWAYTRDDRPWNGPGHPAVVFVYAPDRTAARPAEHLAGFRGILQVDGYTGFEQLAAGGAVTLAACWAQAQPQALCNHPLRQPLAQVQPQHFPYVPHRHSLTWHPGPLLLGRDKANPWLKTVSRTDPARPPAPSQSPRRCSQSAGNHVQDQTEAVFTIHRIQRSR